LSPFIESRTKKDSNRKNMLDQKIGPDSKFIPTIRKTSKMMTNLRIMGTKVITKGAFNKVKASKHLHMLKQIEKLAKFENT
jgi:hypothetical protein